ncbi:MAG TPA: PRTRC system protein B [Terracidiphilus sp.]|jgi:PRTRC genetic system protein B
MKVEVSIGEMHRFELRDALLVYRENRRSFITWHTVTTQKEGPPLLGPAQPLTTGFVEDLAVSLSGGSTAEVLPHNVLAKTDRMITWWTARRLHRMFFENAEGRAKQLNGRLFPQPPLVWKVAHGELKIRALSENTRPKAQSTLAVAPFWNLSDDGGVCLGSMRCPDSASAASIGTWERGFYESAFTHANVGRLTRHEGGHDALWAKLRGRRHSFPTDALIRLPQTLAQFIQGR